MSNTKIRAIPGVSAGVETLLLTKWPSIAAMGIGKFLGQLMASVPMRIVLALPVVAPIAALLYFVQKVVGERFTITTRSVQRWTGLGGRMIQRVELSDVADMQVRQLSGQEFFHASDLLLLNAKGDLIMLLEGLPHAEIFRENITKAREAAQHVQASLNTIKARHNA